VKSAVEPLSPTRVKLTVEVPFEELKPSLDAAYKKIAQQVNVPGFRRGRVPQQVIDQRIGRGVVLDEAVSEALPQFYFQALQENDVQALSQPQVDIGDYSAGTTLEFSAELDVRPAITVPDYEGIEVSVDDVEVTEADVDEQLQGLRARFGSLSTVERPAVDGDFVTIDLAAYEDGELIEEAQATGMSYQLGSGALLDGLDEAVTGLSAGESATFSSSLLGGDRQGQPVDVEVSVQAVKEQQLPEVDDEFAQTASEFDTVDELRADLRERLERGKRLEQAGAARDAVLETLLERVEVPLPDAAVAEELAARQASIREQLSYAGRSEEDYLKSEGQTREEFDAELESRVRSSLAARFLLDELAKHAALSVEEGELSEHLVRRAARSGMKPEEFAQEMVKQGQVPELVSEIVRGKALALVVESAVVTDRSGRPVELRRLQPDGSIAPEDEPAEADAEDAAVGADA
jgi:trigger factor